MRYAKIGGQAVIEGVMMRHKDRYAVAVRKPDGSVEVKEEYYEGLVARCHMTGVPIIRGILAFVDSLYLGMKTLTWSADFYEDEEETAKTDAGREHREEKESGSDKWVMGLTVALSIVLAIGLFMVLPFLISNLFRKVLSSELALGVIEGVVRVLIFVGYIAAISRMKDIQRLFMYHGAEHKTINCIEHGEELTPQNAAKYSRFHKRCGTSFLFIVLFVSILFFLLFFQIVPVDDMLLKVVCRVLLVPVIAGVSYEVIQWAGRKEGRLSDLVSKPGFWMQKMTTKEPDEQMLEVAIASIEAIYDWKGFQKEVSHEDR